MLHVTNGEAAASGLREAGLPGTVLSWDDVLHEGPVPNLPPDALRAVRARFLTEAFAPDGRDVAAELAARDAALDRAVVAGADVVLWFEHDLYDQLQLLQVLDRLGDYPNVALVLNDDYLGPLPPTDLAALFPARERATDAQRVLARRAWAAFTAPDPSALNALLADRTATRPLPHLGAALGRFAEESPWTTDGLTRTERQALAALADGPRALPDLFAHATAADEPRFLGDTTFFDTVRRLVPLVAFEGVVAAITDAGRAVLAGTADADASLTRSLWRGGVHLPPTAPWRYGPDARRLVQRNG